MDSFSGFMSLSTKVELVFDMLKCLSLSFEVVSIGDRVCRGGCFLRVGGSGISRFHRRCRRLWAWSR